MAGIIGAAVAFAVAGAAVNFGMKEVEGGSDFKRHDLVMEKIAKDREHFSEERINAIDAHNARLTHENDSSLDTKETKGELRSYHNNNIVMGGGFRSPPQSSLNEFATVIAITASFATIYVFLSK